MLDRRIISQFEADGVVKLASVFEDWVEPLRAGVAENMASPGPYHREYAPGDEQGRFFGDYCNWNRILPYKKFVFDSPCARLAAALMSSKQVRFFHEHVLVKEPGTTRKTPWHHDQPYYCVDGRQVVSFWIPLDHVPAATCPEFIAGSHRWDKWFLPTKFTGADYNHDDSGMDRMPDIDAHREHYDIRSWMLEPGDAIAFHFRTVHGAPANLSRQFRRRGFAARWLGDDTTYAVRSGEMSPPFPGLDKKLSPGDRLTSEEFPLVVDGWRR